MLRRLWPYLLVALAALTLTARSLRLSQTHPFPAYDEVAYLDRARDFAGRGPAGTIACLLKGECRDDQRQPLYPYLYSYACCGTPGDFPRGKLLSLGAALALLALLAWRAGPLGACAVALSPAVLYLSDYVGTDALFALLYCAALFILGRRYQELAGWLGFGALAGLAYLAKGDGHVLLVSAFAVALLLRGRDFWREGKLFAALGAFAVTASPLLIRNFRVWGSPFHSNATKWLWLDDAGPEFWRVADTPEWDKLGALGYLRSHTLIDCLSRLASGAREIALTVIKALALGSKGFPWWFLTGGVLLALALAGLWRRRREPEAVAIAAANGACLLVLSWAVRTTNANLRYLVPIGASLWPLALDGARGLLANAPRRPWLTCGARVVAAAACLFVLWPARAGFSVDPRRLWSVPPAFRDTSAWIAAHVDAGGYLIDFRSEYSDWDTGQDRRRIYVLSAPEAELRSYIERHAVRFALVDSAVEGAEPFLDWKPCFRDMTGRLSIYSFRCPATSSAGGKTEIPPE